MVTIIAVVPPAALLAVSGPWADGGAPPGDTRSASDASPLQRAPGARGSEAGLRAPDRRPILQGPAEPEPPERPRPTDPRARGSDYRRSRAIGEPEAGRLERGVMLPSAGIDWVSWDPVERDKPNRWWRRWGTDGLVRTTLGVIHDYAREHPNAPRIAIGDLSRPHGGDFGIRYGPIGHASHQNGLDVDVYYPRADRRERPPKLSGQVDVRLSQDLVDRFVAAGAEKVFVGPNLPLSGPPDVVVPLANHDNHLHFRLPGE